MNKVALIFGGPSPEHDVSLFSAKNIYQALKETGLNVLLLGVTHSKKWKLVKGEDLVSTTFQKPLDLNQVGIEIELANENGKIFAKSLVLAFMIKKLFLKSSLKLGRLNALLFKREMRSTSVHQLR